MNEGNKKHRYMPLAHEDTELLIIPADMLDDLITDMHHMAEMIDTLTDMRCEESIAISNTSQGIIDKWIEVIKEGELEI